MWARPCDDQARDADGHGADSDAEGASLSLHAVDARERSSRCMPHLGHDSFRPAAGAPCRKDPALAVQNVCQQVRAVLPYGEDEDGGIWVALQDMVCGRRAGQCTLPLPQLVHLALQKDPPAGQGGGLGGGKRCNVGERNCAGGHRGLGVVRGAELTAGRDSLWPDEIYLHALLVCRYGKECRLSCDIFGTLPARC